MPLDDDAISALAMRELPVRAAGYIQARAAERVAQREAMLAGAAATDNDLKACYAEKIRESETVIQKLNKEIASLGTAVRELAPPVTQTAADQAESLRSSLGLASGASDAEVELRNDRFPSPVRGPPAPNVLDLGAPGRAARVANALEARSMLLPGVSASGLPTQNDEMWEGLQEGTEAEFEEATSAYVEFCNNAQVWALSPACTRTLNRPRTLASIAVRARAHARAQAHTRTRITPATHPRARHVPRAA
eukprot:scaffold7979_cov60-Phaeocystis_antarctica.AAC.1